MGKSSKPKIEVTYYYMSQHLGICVAADKLRRVVVKEKDAWIGSVSGVTATFIDESDLFGGPKKEGGVKGTFTFLPGASDQVLPDILAARYGFATGSEMPGYRGICTIFFTGEGTNHGDGGGGTIVSKITGEESSALPGFMWSCNSPYLPGIWAEVEREPIGLNPAYAFCGGSAGPSAAISIVIDKSSVMNTGSLMETAREGVKIYLEYLRTQIAAGRIIDLEVRRMYSTTFAHTYRSATDADIDDAIAFIDATGTGSTIIGDWRPAARGVRDFFNATDELVDDRQLLWVGRGKAAWNYMGTEGAAIINAIFPLPAVKFFVIHYADDAHAQLIDNTDSDGIPHFADTESAELGAAMIGPIAEGAGPRRDANPAHIIYECLTNTDWGMGAPSSAIDVDSFNDAAVTLYGENFCLSMIWTRQAAVEKFVQEVLDHILAVLFVDPQTGLLTLKLIRDDYDEGTLPELTDSNATLTSFGRKIWGEIVNEIVVTWTNPDTEQDETVTVQDLASITTQGGIISASRNYYGVRNSSLAARLAARDLRTSGAPLLACEAEVDRSLWALRPASVVKVTSVEHGVSGVIMRVTFINYGRPGDPTIKLSLIEDVFGLDAGDYVEPPTTGWEDPSAAPEPVDNSLIFTLPLFFAAATDIAAFVNSPEYPEVIAGVLASSSNGDTQAIELWSEITLPDASLEWQKLNDLTVVGRAELAADAPAEATTTITSLTNFTGKTGPVQGGFVLIGDGEETENEIALVTNVGEDVTVDRGVLDTVPRAWPAGTPVWFVDIDTSLDDSEVRSAGETVSYKLLPRTSAGLLALADAPLASETLTERPWLPNRPADVKCYDGTAFSSFDAPIDARERVDPWVTIDWANRNRLLEDSQVLSWTDATVTPETGQTTKIEVLQTDGVTVLATHSGLTGTSFDVPDASFGSASFVIIRTSSERTDDDGTFESLQSFDHYVLVGGSFRITEAGDDRVTEAGDLRIMEG